MTEISLLLFMLYISIFLSVREVTSQITAVINFVVSVVGSFFFAYKAVEYALPESNIPAVSVFH